MRLSVNEIPKIMFVENDLHDPLAPSQCFVQSFLEMADTPSNRYLSS